MPNPKKITKESIDDWVYKDPTVGCWIWLGSINANGYGSFKSTLAHRVTYQWFIKDFDKKLDVMHLCHNRACVNPHHLRPGTRKENVDMSVRDGRWNKELRSKKQSTVRQKEKRNGFIVGRRKLFSDEAVKEIRRLVDCGESKSKIGTAFNVTMQAINAIAKKKVYKYVD